ncbi:hypothetical protein CLV51_1011438 [Chitinophaga niastensis]|uniref:WD40 repeat protein n=1 Tax=Chitinophaga niastensis TaxID=536980 RepID=A0A2P8HVA6_CHINA|nr:hypothetical protein [Chitinophaga niastensis]PSL50094.1 hypothetical protein CLV51_1011438 [Chitinophaga niastensis]
MTNKILFLLCASALLIWGCNNKPATVATAKDSTPPAINKTPEDTVQIGDKTFFVYFIEKADFDKYPLTPTDSSEADALKKDTLVKRNGDKLTFQLGNGKQRVFTNNFNDDNYIGYAYAANYPTIKRKGAIISYYEGSGYQLINPQNGDTLMTWSAPAISPDKKYILCASMDLVAAFDPNGFQLFSVNNNDIKPIGENNLEDWGPGMIHWINNKTVLSEYITIDEEGNTQVRYIKMVMQ